MSSLFNQYISNTYTGVLHAGGIAIPASGKAAIFDGEGNLTALSLGREDNGVTFTGPTTISGNGTVTGTFTIGGATTINDNLDLNGNGDVSGTLTIGGATTINDNLDLNGNGDVSGTLTVGGATTINDNLQVNGQTDTNTLLVGAVNYPSSNSTVGNLLYQQTATTVGFIDPDDIIISDDSDVVTRTTYITHTLGNAIEFNFSDGGDGGVGALVPVDLSDFVPAEAKAIIGIVMFPGESIQNEDGSYAIFASRNSSTGQKVLVCAAGGGEDGNGPMGSASQFHSRITNQRIYLSINWTGDVIFDVTGWRLCIVAWQQ